MDTAKVSPTHRSITRATRITIRHALFFGLIMAILPRIGCGLDPGGGQMQTVPNSASFEVAFARALTRYREARRAGLHLDQPGAGIGPTSHTALFDQYAHVFYLPVEAEPLLSQAAVNLLRQKVGDRGQDEAAFAQICLEILRSGRKLARTGRESMEVGSFRGVFIIYHYD